MKKEITFDELDAMCQRFEDNPYQCGDWWPTIRDIKERLEPNIKDYIEFAIWITETASEPVTEEQIESRKYLLALINNTLKIKE